MSAMTISISAFVVDPLWETVELIESSIGFGIKRIEVEDDKITFTVTGSTDEKVDTLIDEMAAVDESLTVFDYRTSGSVDILYD